MTIQRPLQSPTTLVYRDLKYVATERPKDQSPVFQELSNARQEMLEAVLKVPSMLVPHARLLSTMVSNEDHKRFRAYYLRRHRFYSPTDLQDISVALAAAVLRIGQTIATNLETPGTSLDSDIILLSAEAAKIAARWRPYDSVCFVHEAVAARDTAPRLDGEALHTITIDPKTIPASLTTRVSRIQGVIDRIDWDRPFEKSVAQALSTLVLGEDTGLRIFSAFQVSCSF
jgi:hypothetical protein